ncbi:MAG: glycosyltransferase family 4 protein [Candidatus Pacebacteria bacterium]|nr:glycosyltransferase family 4 protein [Candidatus Paceibacterota bacterium]
MKKPISESVALSLYPLTDSQAAKFRSVIASVPEFINISSMPKANILKFFMNFTRIRAKSFYILFDSEESKVLLPILRILALLSRSKRFYIITANEAPVATNRFALFADLGLIAFAYISGFYFTLRFWFSLKFFPSLSLRIHNGSNSRILYLKTNFWFGVKSGGSIGHVAGVVNGFIKKGWDLTYVSIDPPVMVSKKAQFLPVVPKQFLVLPFEFNNYKLNFEFYCHLLNNNYNLNYKFIYQRLSLCNYSGLLLAQKFQIPLVVEYNGSEAWASINWGNSLVLPKLAIQAEERMLKEADLLVTVSDVLRDELINKGVAPERIISFPNSIDPKIFNPNRFSTRQIEDLRGNFNIPSDAIVITFVGTFGLWHGAEVLARAIFNICTQDLSFVIANRIYFMMVGNGSRLESVKSIIGQNDRVIYTGLIAQELAPLYLAASDILLSPHVPNSDGSRFFGSPTKLFEYMAMGKPIIASRLEQIEDILTPSQSITSILGNKSVSPTNELAILCEPNQADQLELAIKFLVTHPEWRDRLGENARNHVLSHYTWDHHVEAIEAGLRTINITRSNIQKQSHK